MTMTMAVPLVTTSNHDSSSSTIEIDCYGRTHFPEITISAGGRNWRFVFDPAKKPGRPFALGLYIDFGVTMWRAVLRYPAERRIFVLTESPNEPPFQVLPAHQHQAKLILTHERRLLDLRGGYRRLDYGTNWVGVGDNDCKPSNDFHKNRLVSFVGSLRHPSTHGYSFRKKVAANLIESGRADCYGFGIREVASKTEGLADYAFSICMENVRADYYYTEKIIDCFLTETVPIYWGCPAIGEIFDPRGILTFNDWTDLDCLLSTLTWERYHAMRPFVLENRRRVAALQLTTLQDLYARMAQILAVEMKTTSLTPLSTWRRTKLAAGFRLLANGGRPMR